MLENAKHHLTLQQVAIILLVEGLASVFTAADGAGLWVLKARGGCGNFLKFDNNDICPID